MTTEQAQAIARSGEGAIVAALLQADAPCAALQGRIDDVKFLIGEITAIWGADDMPTYDRLREAIVEIGAAIQ